MLNVSLRVIRWDIAVFLLFIATHCGLPAVSQTNIPGPDRLRSGVEVNRSAQIATASHFIRIPNSLSRKMLEYSQILEAKPTLNLGSGSTMQQLVAGLEKIGLPVLVHHTVLADFDIQNDLLEVDFNRQFSLGQNLVHCLSANSLGFTLTENGLVIIGEDYLTDDPFLMIVTYDVTNIVNRDLNPKAEFVLIYTLTESVMSDSWTQNGGAFSMSHYPLNDRNLLIVLASYEAQRMIAKTLGDVLQLSQAKPKNMGTTSMAQQPMTEFSSQVVEVPGQ